MLALLKCIFQLLEFSEWKMNDILLLYNNTPDLVQINRSSLVSINNLMIRMRQVLSLELHVTKNRRIQQIIEKIDAMLA